MYITNWRRKKRVMGPFKSPLAVEVGQFFFCWFSQIFTFCQLDCTLSKLKSLMKDLVSCIIWPYFTFFLSLVVFLIFKIPLIFRSLLPVWEPCLSLSRQWSRWWSAMPKINTSSRTTSCPKSPTKGAKTTIRHTRWVSHTLAACHIQQ